MSTVVINSPVKPPLDWDDCDPKPEPEKPQPKPEKECCDKIYYIELHFH